MSLCWGRRAEIAPRHLMKHSSVWVMSQKVRVHLCQRLIMRFFREQLSVKQWQHGSLHEQLKYFAQRNSNPQSLSRKGYLIFSQATIHNMQVRYNIAQVNDGLEQRRSYCMSAKPTEDSGLPDKSVHLHFCLTSNQ